MGCMSYRLHKLHVLPKLHRLTAGHRCRLTGSGDALNRWSQPRPARVVPVGPDRRGGCVKSKVLDA